MFVVDYIPNIAQKNVVEMQSIYSILFVNQIKEVKLISVNIILTKAMCLKYLVIFAVYTTIIYFKSVYIKCNDAKKKKA